jgi:hypothetical protein
MSALGEIFRRITQYGLETVLHRYYSRYPARVVSNDYGDGQQELELHIPLIHQVDSTARVKSYGIPSGKNYGAQSIPQVGDMVYVTFQMGDIRSPRWNYGWYANGELPEEFKDKKVHGFKSPAGHSVLIDDTKNTVTVTMNEGKTLMLSKDVIEINGDSLGGLVMVQGCLDKINQLESKVNSLVSKHNTHTHLYIAPSIPLPGPPIPTAPTLVTDTPIIETKLSDLENITVKHGNN